MKKIYVAGGMYLNAEKYPDEKYREFKLVGPSGSAYPYVSYSKEQKLTAHHAHLYEYVGAGVVELVKHGDIAANDTGNPGHVMAPAWHYLSLDQQQKLEDVIEYGKAYTL